MGEIVSYFVTIFFSYVTIIIFGVTTKHDVCDINDVYNSAKFDCICEVDLQLYSRCNYIQYYYLSTVTTTFYCFIVERQFRFIFAVVKFL